MLGEIEILSIDKFERVGATLTCMRNLTALRFTDPRRFPMAFSALVTIASPMISL